MQLGRRHLCKDSSLRVLFEYVGGKILKTETFEVITEFENVPSAQASLGSFKEILCEVPEEIHEG